MNADAKKYRVKEMLRANLTKKDNTEEQRRNMERYIEVLVFAAIYQSASDFCIKKEVETLEIFKGKGVQETLDRMYNQMTGVCEDIAKYAFGDAQNLEVSLLIGDLSEDFIINYEMIIRYLLLSQFNPNKAKEYKQKIEYLQQKYLQMP